MELRLNGYIYTTWRVCIPNWTDRISLLPTAEIPDFGNGHLLYLHTVWLEKQTRKNLKSSKHKAS